VKITTRHTRSSYGIPVILDDRGRVVDYHAGIRLACEKLGWDRPTLAARCNVSVPTVNGWLSPGAPRMPEVRCLLVLRDALADAGVAQTDAEK